MNSEETKACMSMKYIRCGLHHYGCKDWFLPNQVHEHYLSDIHMKSIITMICAKKLNHESALIDLAIDPLGVGAPSSAAAIAANSNAQFFEQLTNCMIEFASPSDQIATTSYQEFDSVYASSRALIQQMDRHPNLGLNLQANHREQQLNETMMNLLSSRITTSSSDDEHGNRRTEQNQSSSSTTEQNTIQFYENSNALLQIKLDEMPVSTDGCLIWPLPDISNKIDNAISKKQMAIDSPSFETIMHGHRLFGRVYLNGKTDPKVISLHVHLNPPVRDTLRADIIFILVDQSKNIPLQHFIKRCSGEMNDINSCLGFDKFIDKNMIQKEGNPYVLDNSICLLIYIKQTNQDKFANLPPNVQDALNVAGQM